MRLERSQWEELEKRIRHDFLLQDPRIRFYNDKGIFVVTSHIFLLLFLPPLVLDV